MDNFDACKSFHSCLNPYRHKSQADELDINDTIDCFTLPEIDIPHQQSCWFTNLPGSIYPFETECSRTSSIVDTGDINTCNTSPPPPCRTPEALESKVSNARDTTTSPPLSSVREQIALHFLNCDKVKFEKDTNVSAKETTLLMEGGTEESEQGYVSAKDNVDSSNVNKTTASKTTRPNSAGRFAKYAFDPPKTVSSCPRPKQTLKSGPDVSQSEAAELQKSTVYVTHNSSLMYQLQFYAKNTVLLPLYVSPRLGTRSENEKKVQPDNYEYRDCARGADMAVHLVRRKYAVSMDDKSSKLQKAILPPIRVYTDELPSTHKRPHSEPGREVIKGSMHFVYRGISLKIRTPVFTISTMKLPVREDILIRMAELNMPTSESRKNKGIIIGRCGSDIVQLQFDMDEVMINRMEIKGTAAVQTEDKMVYIREKSNITGRLLLLALPESTYFYQDPMTTIHRLHANFQRSNVIPLWKYELMKARLAERRGVTEVEAKLEKIFQQTRGSRLCFEGLNALITAQAGLLCCEVSVGHEMYEELMREFQGTKYQRKRPPLLIKSNNKGLFGNRPQTAASSKTSEAESEETMSATKQSENE
ncbi:hypothetical protein EG68_01010 [Paragonimus skrjabini miyazakii]|uniref:Uncharacterized protein n=1 Tax=Paragonimus skrjabini miyazakii TaxID=59628 RepID=A0A8S9Z990_9TREM|nr:hypothetical protein EG68_01010 [Paragonimus skrjabini miyazakii]